MPALALLVGVDVAEHVAARVGHQAQRLVAGVAARRQVDALAQAYQVALLQVEQRAFVDQRVEQAVLDQEQLLVRQLGRQVVGTFQADGLRAGGEAGKQLGGNPLQAADQLVGIGRLFTE